MNLDAAFKIVKEFEGCKLHAYLDSVGVPTIGYGYTHGVHMGMVWTQAQADQALVTVINTCAQQIKGVVKPLLSDNQYSALVSFVYNVGFGAFYHSHMLAAINQGAGKDAVGREFLKWDHAGGHVLPGLTRRRKAEEALYLA